MKRTKSGSGAALIRRWHLPVAQARFHAGGTFFMPLDRFPGALCDPAGYVIFHTRSDFERCGDLTIGSRVNVRRGSLPGLPGYVAGPFACTG
jgi:hypothetical protein